jgi:hypothetical protein
MTDSFKEFLEEQPAIKDCLTEYDQIALDNYLTSQVSQALLSDRARLVERLEKEKIINKDGYIQIFGMSSSDAHNEALDKAISIIKESR